MASTLDAKEHYISAYREAEERGGTGSAHLRLLRERAIGSFGRIGFPSAKQEAWRHTALGPLTRPSLALAPRIDTGGVTRSQLAPFTLSGDVGAEIVFVNGTYAPALSTLGDLADGVTVGPLGEACEGGAPGVQKHLAGHAGIHDNAFAALNTAFLHDGVLVYIPRGVALASPVHILYFATGGEEATISHPRGLVVAEDRSRATVVETYAGGDGQAYLTNAVTEIAAGSQAEIRHVRLVSESASASHVGVLQISQGPNSRVSSHNLTLHGGLVRNEVSARLEGEGGESTLNGLYVLDGEQHVDNYTLLEHAEPGCSSHELYKGVLTDTSTAVFRGKIHVHQNAQRTDAYQSNQNLLLSDRARVNTKPQLEIYADDVKCSHGATVGQLDDSALYYLRSRGIGAELARHVLLEAFVDDILGRIGLEAVHRRVAERVHAKFPTVAHTRS